MGVEVKMVICSYAYEESDPKCKGCPHRVPHVEFPECRNRCVDLPKDCDPACMKMPEEEKDEGLMTSEHNTTYEEWR